MQRMHFCSGAAFVTGDDIATALLHYTGAIATFRKTDVVTIPIVSPAGGHATVTLLLNSVSQISAESVEYDGAELRDDLLVDRLDGLTQELVAPANWDEFGVRLEAN